MGRTEWLCLDFVIFVIFVVIFVVVVVVLLRTMIVPQAVGMQPRNLLDRQWKFRLTNVLAILGSDGMVIGTGTPSHTSWIDVSKVSHNGVNGLFAHVTPILFFPQELASLLRR